MQWKIVGAHTVVLLAAVAGVVGMGIVFSGVTHGSTHTVMQGVPLLLLGLWWAGRELGRSMLASRAHHAHLQKQPAATGAGAQRRNTVIEPNAGHRHARRGNGH